MEHNMQLMALAIVLCTSVPLILDARRHAINIINAKSIVFVGIYYWILLDPLTLRSYDGAMSSNSVNNVFLMIVIFCVFVFVGYSVFHPKLFVRIFKGLDYGRNFKPKVLFFTAFLSFLAGIMPMIFWGGGLDSAVWYLTHSGRWAPWDRGRWGGWRDWITTGCSYIQVLSVQLAGLYLVFIKRNIVLILTSVLTLFIAFRIGGRLYLGAMVLPILVLYYMKQESYLKKSRKILSAIAFFGLMVVMQLQFIVRSTERTVPLGEIIMENFNGVVRTNPTNYHRDDQFYQMVKYVELVPSVIPHSGEMLIFRPLYHYVPRAIWKNKPEGITRFFESATNQAGAGITTYAGSIIGDFYLCNGLFGVMLAGLLLGFLARQFDSLLEMAKRSPAVLLVYCYGLLFLFTSIRSYQVVYENWYVFVFLYLALSVARKRSDPCPTVDERMQGNPK